MLPFFDDLEIVAKSLHFQIAVTRPVTKPFYVAKRWISCAFSSLLAMWDHHNMALQVHNACKVLLPYQKPAFLAISTVPSPACVHQEFL